MEFVHMARQVIAGEFRNSGVYFRCAAERVRGFEWKTLSEDQICAESMAPRNPEKDRYMRIQTETE